MKQKLVNIINAWDEFWFAPRSLLGLAFMRILLCGTMLWMYILRFFYVEYYSDQSWIPRSFALDIMWEGYRPPFLWFFWPDSLAPAMHVILIVLLALLTLGIGGRWLMWITWIIDIAFVQRNYAVNFGADIIAALFLFYMSFTQSCERLNLMNLFRPKTQFKKSDTLSSLMIRMMQVQISVIYAYTGFEKLKGGSWWDGTALWSVMANPQMTTMDFTFLRVIPWSIALIGFVTIVFEIYWPVMVVIQRTRYAWLLLGFSFHMGIAFAMGLVPFSFVMVSTYFLFIDDRFLEKVLPHRHRLLKV